MSSEIVRIRGKDVLINEGDLLCTRGLNWWAWGVSLVSGGISHVNTVVRVGGKLVALSVCYGGWRDEHGNVWSGGITAEPLWLFGSTSYDAFWVVSPRTPRTEEQLVRLRLRAAELLRQDDGSGAIYDAMDEFAMSCLGLPNATRKKYHCGELAAELAKTQGVWPAGATTSVPLTTLIAQIGDIRQVY